MVSSALRSFSNRISVAPECPFTVTMPQACAWRSACRCSIPSPSRVCCLSDCCHDTVIGYNCHVGPAPVPISHETAAHGRLRQRQAAPGNPRHFSLVQKRLCFPLACDLATSLLLALDSSRQHFHPLHSAEPNWGGLVVEMFTASCPTFRDSARLKLRPDSPACDFR